MRCKIRAWGQVLIEASIWFPETRRPFFKAIIALPAKQAPGSLS